MKKYFCMLLILTCAVLLYTATAWAAMSGEDFLKLCASGTRSEIERAIKAGANIAAVDDDGNTTLHYAAGFNEDQESVAVLIENGADVNARNDDIGLTPLIVAAGRRENDTDVLSMLIEAGADVNAAAHFGRTALHYSAEYNENPEVSKFLLENGAVLERKDDGGTTPLMTAAHYNEIPVISLLLEAGASITEKNEDGRSPLMLAATINQSLEVFSFLLENGADVSARDSEGKTALFYAVIFTHNPTVVELLLEHGAKIDEQDEEGKTALIWACEGGLPNQIENIIPLLDNDADVGIADNAGKKAKDYLPESKPDAVGEEEWKAITAHLKGEEYTREDEAENLLNDETAYVLKAEDADLSEAPDVIVEGSPPNLGGWRVGNKVSFSVDLKQPGGYTVFLDYSKEESVGDYANLRITFKNEESGSSMSVGGPLPDTGDSWADYVHHEFCSVWPLEAGKTTVSLESANPEGDGYVMNLRSVTIR